MNKKWTISLIGGVLLVLAFVGWFLHTPSFDLSSYVPLPGPPAPFSYYIHPGRIIKDKYFSHHITVLYLLSWPKQIIAVNIAGEWKFFKKSRVDCPNKVCDAINWEKETKGGKILFSIIPVTQGKNKFGEKVSLHETWRTNELKIEAFFAPNTRKLPPGPELPPGLQL